MANERIIEPDLRFINGVIELGGSSLKKCFQCATCSVICPLSPDENPFPRKQMVLAQWGQKETLVKDPNVWLCHNCQDCSNYCPRGARPGDVMNAIRSYTISNYAIPKWLSHLVRDIKYLPLLLGLPFILFLLIALITGNLPPAAKEIKASNLIPGLAVDAVFVPLSIVLIASLSLSLFRFWKDMTKAIDPPSKYQMLLKGGWWGILFSAIKEILAHSRFFKCGINKNRAIPHLLVLFSFIGLFIVTSLEFFGEQLLHIMELPLSLGHPIKLLANLSGIALLIGIGLVFNNRLKDKETPSTYWDWSLIGVILTVGVTGFLVEIFRLLNVALFAYAFYLLHLSFVFALFIYLPYSKFAHLAYRTLAIVNEKYSTKA